MRASLGSRKLPNSLTIRHFSSKILESFPDPKLGELNEFATIKGERRGCIPGQNVHLAVSEAFPVESLPDPKLSDPKLQFSPKQIASSLQVSESSVKRWCDRGVIPTVRTVGGHRRITLSGLREFLDSTNRTLVDPVALGISPADLNLASKRPVGRSSVVGQRTEPTQDEFRAALANGEESRCLEMLLERVSQGWTRSEAAEDLIVSAMHGLGDAWDCGQLEVYQERRSCTICSRLIYQLRESLPPLPPDAPVAIGAAPESDPYQLPSALVELALRESGWNAVNLGNDIPLESLIQAARDYRPKMAWLSVTSIDDANRFVREQNKLADSLDEKVSLIVGGRGLDDQLRPKLRYTAHCDSLRHLIELADILKR